MMIEDQCVGVENYILFLMMMMMTSMYNGDDDNHDGDNYSMM